MDFSDEENDYPVMDFNNEEEEEEEEVRKPVRKRRKTAGQMLRSKNSTLSKKKKSKKSKNNYNEQDEFDEKDENEFINKFNGGGGRRKKQNTEEFEFLNNQDIVLSENENIEKISISIPERHFKSVFFNFYDEGGFVYVDTFNGSNIPTVEFNEYKLHVIFPAFDIRYNSLENIYNPKNIIDAPQPSSFFSRDSDEDYYHYNFTSISPVDYQDLIDSDENHTLNIDKYTYTVTLKRKIKEISIIKEGKELVKLKNELQKYYKIVYFEFETE
eukprot:TRINITY_DN580_c1_g1_i1.p1 TRINITY_DN580_c1_g1~~TRINITY_DN580_c1_g1_i1.p1  ORF type:complete len:271 (-),score=81.64 TRINITY_DN580_c1_g1_i1:208-1020(-)